MRRGGNRLVAGLWNEYVEESRGRGAPEELVSNPAGSYLLYRVGDAVSSRNIHAAIYGSLGRDHGL